MSKSRFARGPAAAFGLSVFLALAATPCAGLAQTKPAADATAPTDAERAQFRAEVRGASEAMAMLVDAFPDEYRALETKVITGVKSGQLSDDQIRALSYEWSSGLRGRIMADVYKAPDADLIAVGKLQLEIMRYLGGTNPRACYEFVEQGGLSQDSAVNLGDEARARVNKLGVLQMRAGHAGARTPVVRAPLTEAQVQPTLAAFQKKGGDPAWLAAASNATSPSSFSAAQRCTNAQYWIEAILDQPAPVAASILAAK